MSVLKVSGATVISPTSPRQQVKGEQTIIPALETSDAVDEDICSAKVEQIRQAPRGELIVPHYVLKHDVVNSDMIDPYECTYEEFCRLLSALSEHSRYGEVDFSLPGEFNRYDGSTEKLNYHQVLADYVTKQSYSGNMIETYRCGGIASALADAYYEVAGCVEYINGQRVYHMIPGAIGYIPSFPSFSLRENGANQILNLVFTYDSSAENPILEVERYGSDGCFIEKQRVIVNDVNPRNATLHELYALSCYYDLLRNNAANTDWRNPRDVKSYEASFITGVSIGFFQTSSSMDFFSLRQDWIKLIADRMSDAGAQMKQKLEMIQDLFDMHLEMVKKDQIEKESRLERLFYDEADERYMNLS